MKVRNWTKWTPLFLSNFMGVLNDNFLKYSIIFMAISWSLPTWFSQSQLIALVSFALVIPYVFLSPLGGMLATRYSKRKVFLFFKLLEIPIMAIACVAFYYQYVFLAIFSVLLMGIQSSLYSPAKYSLIRDIGGEKGVSFGTGVFEMMAFLGILAGTVLASYMADRYSYVWVLICFLGFAIIGYLVTSQIRAKEIAAPQELKIALHPFAFIIQSYHKSRAFPMLNAAVFGSAFFWFLGSILQMNIVIHSTVVYGLSNTETGVIVSIVAIALGVGCWIAGKILTNTNIYVLLLVGISGIAISSFVLGIYCYPLRTFLALLVILSLCGGLFQVTCLSLIQKTAKEISLADIFAYVNLLTFICILIGAGLFSLINWMSGDNSFYIFFLLSAISFLLTFFYFFKVMSIRKLH
ncbi:MAG: MFS transporter [Paludibacteraceae bacterium]|nr:MFS transporter [Paludibacteraceae bacterium]MBP6437237.1 MFS transporter [Paludibacteraceae bacterium]